MNAISFNGYRWVGIGERIYCRREGTDDKTEAAGLRSIPARMLHQDQLLVERDAVSKITKVDHAIPHNTVIAEVTDQVTGEASTRTLRWDQHVTTESPSRSR